MDKEKKIELSKFNSEQQNDLVLFDVIKQENSQRLFYLVKEKCYPVTPFVLNLMLDFGMEKQLPKLLEVCESYDSSIYNWLCVYWGQDKTDDFCCQNSFDDIVREKMSLSSLIRNKMWEVLSAKKQLSSIPDDWLLAHPSEKAAQTLLSRDLEKYAAWALEHEFYHALLWVKNGYTYLLKAGRYDWVLNNARFLGLSIQEIEKILLDNEDTNSWRNFEDELLAAGLPDVSIRHHSTNKLLLCNYPELVDWEYLWEHNDSELVRSHLLECAAENKKVTITKNFLKKHRPQPWWRRLFG